VPFKEIMRYKLFSPLFMKNVVGNMLLFLPYGYFVGRYFSEKSKFLSFFLILLASIAIECTQVTIGRVFDVDDIILNVFGGMIGYLLYLFIDKIYNSLPKILKSNLFLNIIFSILFIIFVILLVMLFI
jgi:glycopeptide antibiotics resistance protein